jgi:hypothetical protein
MFKPSRESLEILRKISDQIDNQTFHHHYHILYDIAMSFDDGQSLNYLEIGCYAGGSACLMLQRPNTNVISIDLGSPINKEVVIENVRKLNVNQNNYNYIQGNSQDIKTIANLENLLNGELLDILFIDGDHSYNSVISDFNIYKKYVKKGGYIVFDDYNDSKFSPEVRMAVDSLDLKNYELIGIFGSEFRARPEDHISNEFVIKKVTEEDNKIAIVISTYYRPDGRTKYLLERNLNSLKNQTNKNFKVFLIGDKYENLEEFNSFSNIIDNIYVENLEYAKEREKYTGHKLWCSGGVNASNYGIKKALSDGYDWVINMDHDDYFLPTHIQDIKNKITDNSVFVCSKSNFKNISTLPNIDSQYYVPRACNLVKSSACVNFSKVNIFFRDVYEEEGRECPSDADFWDRLNYKIIENRYESFCTNKITCIHDEEGYSKSNLNN